MRVLDRNYKTTKSKSSMNFQKFGTMLIVIGIMIMLFGTWISYKRHSQPVSQKLSLPEEISQARPGDKMQLRRSNDTTYLEFCGKCAAGDNVQIVTITNN